MKEWITMVDRSCWDQSFIDADSTLTAGRCVSCADRLVDVFELSNDENWLRGFLTGPSRGVVRKSSSCAEGRSWPSMVNDDDDIQRLNGCCTDPPTVLCSSPSSGPDSGRASTSDERIYQNGSVAVDGHSSSSCTSAERGCSDVGPGTDLILLDSGAFSESSGSSVPVRTPSEVQTGSSGCASQSSNDLDVATQSWVTSTAAGAAYCRIASFLPEWDVERLESAYRQLAACGFYYGRMTIDEATERLSRWPVGAFLLRDSSDSRYLFSLSVQTCRGTTSIRMYYRSGLFRLDCSAEQEHLMPTFDCPLRLVAHYVRLCTGAGHGNEASPSNGPAGVRRNRHSYVLLESSGRRDTPVLLIRPCRQNPPSLSHLCRRTVQRALYDGGCGDTVRDSAVDRLQLQPSLKTYLKQYPYDL